MKCADCTYWSKNTDNDYPDNFEFGKCKKVIMFWNATEWEEPDLERRILTDKAKGNKAFVQDGSDYRAELITVEDFGCVQFKGT